MTIEKFIEVCNQKGYKTDFIGAYTGIIVTGSYVFPKSKVYNSFTQIGFTTGKGVWHWMLAYTFETEKEQAEIFYQNSYSQNTGKTYKKRHTTIFNLLNQK
jgi:hypothetical protein